MKYLIGVKEIWEQLYEVESESEEEALSTLENKLSGIASALGDEEVKIIEDSFSFDRITEKDQWVVLNKETGFLFF